jgi:aspartate/methionine/tyrosine aminotransferase
MVEMTERLRGGALPAREFALERFYARWEFAVAHNLSASDVEPVGLADLLALADDECAALWDGLRLGYTESAGHPLLRAEIAALYDAAGPGDVLTFAGAEEGILLAMNALVRAGDHAVVVTPAYQSLYDVARAIGAEATAVPLRAEEGWRLDVDRVLEEVRPRTRLVVVNFPNNPTGALPSPGEMRRLQAGCAERGARLFSDEVYRGVEPEAGLRLPAATDLGADDLSLGVMSKAYGLAGLRIGWIVCRDEDVLRRIAALKDYTTICSSAPSELLAVIALRARDVLIARATEIVAHNRALLDAFFDDHADRVRWVPPRGGTTAFPRLIDRDADAFCARLAADDGVLLLPGSRFDVPGGHFRIGLGRRGIEAGLEVVGERLRG